MILLMIIITMASWLIIIYKHVFKTCASQETWRTESVYGNKRRMNQLEDLKQACSTSFLKYQCDKKRVIAFLTKQQDQFWLNVGRILH